jgi:hypothetical protein
MIDEVHRFIVPTAFALLPPTMRSDRATAMLLAIGLQESRFLHRRQFHNGPARGFWMFERGGGITGVLQHERSQRDADRIVRLLRYDLAPSRLASTVHVAIEHNDILAACFARLLLWTVPGVLPGPNDDPQIAWEQYLEGWRPGAPHRETWDNIYAEAWARVEILRRE